MLDINEQDISKWSYYDSMIRSQNIQKGFEKYPKLEENIVEMIKNDQLDRARDLRDGLPKIIESGQELVKTYFRKD